MTLIFSLKMERSTKLYLYFGLWVFIVIVLTILNIFNTDWDNSNVVSGILLLLILTILQGFVMEIPVQTIFCLILGGYRREVRRADRNDFTSIINYNLLATSKDEIDECFHNMFEAYMGNLSPNISCVLVSATKSKELKDYELFMRDKYRSLIFDALYQDGMAFHRGNFEKITNLRLNHVWKKYQYVPMLEFKRSFLFQICFMFSENFMVIHRTTSVLRKCGQYQDLMLLSDGELNAFTYCDKTLYSSAARKPGEPMFVFSEDVYNIIGRGYDYTLVLDSDTEVPTGTVFSLLNVAAAHPDRGIIQPAIVMNCKQDATWFMQVEKMRQEINEPLTNSNAAMLQQSSFFGKGLINNSIYIKNILGTKKRLIERVPIDVLSHDTFEASLLRPLYVGDIYLKEAPSYNYVSWNIRERRWNKGELILAIYFFENLFGKPVRFIQRKLQRSKFVDTKLRTKTELDFVSSYVAHSPLRNMLVKPLLLVYVIVHIFSSLIYPYASISLILFLIIVFPKFATCNRRNYKYVVLESFLSIMQYTPEAVTGSVRIIRALQSVLSNNTKWTPQRTVEIQFQNSNPFLSSVYHLWGYALFALISSAVVILFFKNSYLFLFVMFTLFSLPLFTGITSLSPSKGQSKAQSPSVAVTVASRTFVTHLPAVSIK